MTGVLELRGVLEKVAAIARRALPHDLLGVATVSEDGQSVRVYAVTGGEVPADVPEHMTIEEAAIPPEPWEYTIIDDLARGASQAPRTVREGAARLGLRSMLRLPVRFEGRLAGVVNFTSREPGAYSREDLLAASRIRDHIALALSHQRLAEMRVQLAEERERSVRAEERVKALTVELNAASGYARVVGDSPQWREVLGQAEKVAPTVATVLITGESGTGKEVVARWIHRRSRRSDGPFIVINCAALPESLLESELFGYEKGAFSGAFQARAGRIEQAAHGTLFLDEIGEMSPAVQAKVLRFVEQREVQRLGGQRAFRADVRVIAATNRDLKAASARGDFREDLYYRVSVFEIRTPPLRERPEDILPLAEAFLEEIGPTLGRPPAGVARDARERLLAHRWPGNVRELKNALERACILAEGDVITSAHLGIAETAPTRAPATTQPAPAHGPTGPAGHTGADVSVPALERSAIERALIDTHYNKTRAAKRLGLSRGQLYQRIKKYGIQATPPTVD